MECREIREIVSAYVDGEAHAAEVRAVEDHLGACPACRSLAGTMRVLGDGVGKIEGKVPPGFRDALFDRLEREDLLPRRRSLFAFAVRWTAVPLAAAAALALFILTARETGKGPASPPETLPRVAQGLPGGESHVSAGPGATSGSSASVPPVAGTAPSAGGTGPVDSRLSAESSRFAAEADGGARGLSAEEREIVAYLELLEDPSSLDEPGEVDEMDLFEPAAGRRGSPG